MSLELHTKKALECYELNGRSGRSLEKKAGRNAELFKVTRFQGVTKTISGTSLRKPNVIFWKRIWLPSDHVLQI